MWKSPTCVNSGLSKGGRQTQRPKTRQRAPGADELRDPVAAVAARRPADELADEPAANHAGPVAEQVAEALELLLLDQLPPRVGVALLDRGREQLDELLVLRDAGDDL